MSSTTEVINIASDDEDEVVELGQLGTVQCPICRSTMDETEINDHLDECEMKPSKKVKLNPTASSSPSQSSSSPVVSSSSPVHVSRPVNSSSSSSGVVEVNEPCPQCHAVFSLHIECSAGHVACTSCTSSSSSSSSSDMSPLCSVSNCTHPLTPFCQFALAHSHNRSHPLITRWFTDQGGKPLLDAIDSPPTCSTCHRKSRHCTSATQSYTDLSLLTQLVHDTLHLPSHATSSTLYHCEDKKCGADTCRLCGMTVDKSLECEEHFLSLTHLIARFIHQQTTSSVSTSRKTRSKGKGGKRGRGAGGGQAKGVGYGGGMKDVKRDPRVQENQHKSDEQIVAGLDLLYQHLNNHQHLLLRSSLSSRAIATLLHSPLLTVLLHHLHNDSIIDMSDRHDVFYQLLRLIRLCSRVDLGLSVVLVYKVDVTSVFTVEGLMTTLGRQGQFFVNSQQRTELSDEQEELQALSLCADLCTTEVEVRSAVRRLTRPIDEEHKGEEVSSAVSVPSIPRFDSIDLQHEPTYAFASRLKNKEGNKSRECLSRLRKEWSTLASQSVIPDGIFVRVDEVRMDVMRFVIIGPIDTPYENGLFLFDCYFPDSYPNTPPEVKFLTTGGGRWRANPNLYNDGKVCLSLLGTWAGTPWSAKDSTVLQLLVSVQSMILVAEPFYNEPSFEQSKGTAQGEVNSRLYNERVRQGTVQHAMVDLINDRRLVGGFSELVQSHFRGQRERIVERVGQWRDEEQARVVPPPVPQGYQGYNQNGEYVGVCPSLVQSVPLLISKLQAME